MRDLDVGPKTVRKPLSFLKDSSNLRDDLGDEQELLLLGESLRVRQLQPVLALADGTVIAGFRRIAAARLVGLESLLVTIYDSPLSPEELKTIQFTENFHRLGMNGYAIWKCLDDMLKANPGWGPKELCNCLKMHPSAVTKYLSPSKCIPAWQEALRHEEVCIADCYPASQLPESEQVRLLEMKRSGANRDTLARAVRKSKSSSNRSVVRSSRVTIPLSSGSRVMFSGRNHSLPELVDVLNECLAVVRDGIKRRLDVKLFQDALKLESASVPGAEHASA